MIALLLVLAATPATPPLLLLTATPATPSPPPKTCTVWPNTDLNGHDLQRANGTWSTGDCCAACSKTAGCKFWTFMGIAEKGGLNDYCFLKTSDAGRRGTPSAVKSCTSGLS